MSEIIMQGPAAVSFGGMVEDFISFIGGQAITRRKYRTDLKQFAAWTRYAGVDIAASQRKDIMNYADWLGVEHDAIEYAPDTLAGWAYRLDRAGRRIRLVCKPSTIKQYIQSVKLFFSWTASRGLYPNIAERIKTPRVTETHKKDSLSAAAVQAIEGSITATAEAREQAAFAAVKDIDGRIERSTQQGKRLYALFVLTVNAGLRTVELSRACVRDLEVIEGQAYLNIWGKGHAEPDQKKALAPAVYAAIREYLASRTDHPTGTSPLFVATGNRSGGQALAPTTIGKMLKGAMVTAGYDSERITAHSLRHTAGRAVMEITGENIYKTQMYMRHTSPKTTEIYLDNSQAAQGAALAARLYDHYHGAQPTAPDNLDTLTEAARQLSPEQIKQLAFMAEAMAKAERA